MSGKSCKALIEASLCKVVSGKCKCKELIGTALGRAESSHGESVLTSPLTYRLENFETKTYVLIPYGAPKTKCAQFACYVCWQHMIDYERAILLRHNATLLLEKTEYDDWLDN